jgi:hypothetical protein
MRRLISVLAAGLLAAGSTLASGVASAGTTASCTPEGSYYFSVSANGTNYYLGTPTKTGAGKAAILRPSENSTTLWTLTGCPKGDVFENRGLVLTSKATTTGAKVMLEPAGNGGDGFPSQQWFIATTTSGTWNFNNVKTVLWLAIRGSGPVMGGTLTTADSPTEWNHSQAG